MDLALPKQPPAPLAPAEHFLARADLLIDWSQFDRAASEEAAALIDPVPTYAIRIALLKQWYGLAEHEASFQVLDRLSFRRFVGFVGDGSASDVRIVNELSDGAWARHPDMVDALESVEAQLRVLGYAVRYGSMAEPSLQPCTESGGAPRPSTRTTELFGPGELGRMVEAVTAKAHAEGVMPPAPAVVAAAGEAGAHPVHAPAPVESRLANEPQVRAVLEWPWGLRTELTEHLNIGRDYEFSPLAKQLTPHTHVSRRHAELLVYGDGVWVRDLGSRNGTFVNDDEVPKGQAYLIDSDSIIRFGPLLAVSLKLSA
jgi:IS5 family transposase